MIYIGIDDGPSTPIIHLAYINSWDKDALLADGLELENGMDFVYPDGDVTVIKEIFERGFEA